MKKQSASTMFPIFAVLVIIAASLACSSGTGDEGSEVSMQQTMVALNITQTAMAVSVQDDQQAPAEPDKPEDPGEPEGKPPEEEPEDEPADVPEETPEDPPDVVYEGISFSFDPQIAGGIVPTTIPGQNLGEGYMPSETYPTHFEFGFSGYGVLDHFHTPIILIYPVDEFRTISPYASDVIDKLQQTLLSKPGGGTMSDFPHLPMWNAAQMFAAKVSYYDFKNGSGVRFLTMYGQDVYPVDNQNMVFTYQGLTSDGRFYISANLPLTHFGLPFDGATVMGDYMTFHENWDTYIADTVTWLNVQDPANFFPDITKLDEMMASFEINR